MSELSKKYEELIASDAKAAREDTLRELETYRKEQAKKIAGAQEEPRAMAGPYSYTVGEIMDHVERETKIGRDVVTAMIHLKANMAGGGQ